MLRRPSPALAVASLALAVSLSGTGYAAYKLPANSVGTAQLKKGAVNSLKVKNASLLAADFRPGQLPAGPQGPAGPEGAKGDKGDKGDAGANGATTVVVRKGTGASVGPGGISFAQVLCDSGEHLTGGGADYSGSGKPTVRTSVPVGGSVPTGWLTGVRQDAASGQLSAVAYAICVKP